MICTAQVITVQDCGFEITVGTARLGTWIRFAAAPKCLSCRASIKLASSPTCSIGKCAICFWIESTWVKVALGASNVAWVSCAAADKVCSIPAGPPGSSRRTRRREGLSRGKVGRHIILTTDSAVATRVSAITCVDSKPSTHNHVNSNKTIPSLEKRANRKKVPIRQREKEVRRKRPQESMAGRVSQPRENQATRPTAHVSQRKEAGKGKEQIGRAHV